MEEPFLVNINCSKILGNCDESQYTMFVDPKKMSIVYELTEWIRWMFCLEDCFYFMNENNVIHELEDIQLLSTLKNFEIRPCGQANCVHKKMYRSLLDNLNLFVSWKNVKVHKFFIDKLTKLDKKLFNENASGSLKYSAYTNFTQNSTNPTAKNDYSKFLCNDIPAENASHGTPLWKKQVFIDNFIPQSENATIFSGEVNHNENVSHNISKHSKGNFNCLNSFGNSESKCLMSSTEKNNENNISHSSPMQNELTVQQLTSKSPAKSSSCKKPQRQIKPFSVGELLSNMRQDFEKQKNEETTRPSSQNSSNLEEGSFNEKISDKQHSFVNDYNMAGGRKRPRTRRRKRVKKQSLETEEYISPFLSAIINVSSQSNFNNSKVTNKPNHIRFDVENYEEMEIDCLKTGFSAEGENGFKINEEVKDTNTTFVQTESCTIAKNQNLTNLSENVFPVENTNNEMDYSYEDVSQTEQEGKIIDLDYETPNCASHSLTGPEIPTPLNQDLSLLLKLKEKLKNGVVIQRF